MSNYRVEIRIFGLLIFALVSTLLLAYGLEASDVQGEVLGIKFTVMGPSAAFIVMILIFFATGLFKFGLEDDGGRTLNYPAENLSLNEIDDMLDELLVKSRRIERRKQQLEAAKAALQTQSTQADVMTASGMRPVQRPQGNR